jgi:hypothetical protein
MQPAGPNRDLRVIGYYSESDVQVGCGPTHPSVRVVLKKFDDDNKVTSYSSYIKCFTFVLNQHIEISVR